MIKTVNVCSAESASRLAIPDFEATHALSSHETAATRSPAQYLFIFVAWAATVAWFHPRLAGLLTIAEGPLQWAALAWFVLFIEIAWLYAWFNVSVIVFGAFYRWHAYAPPVPATRAESLPVALLYTTCNDFVEASALSCVQQDYPHFTVYLLDDSTLPEFRARIDAFARAYPGIVRVVRRPNRRGFKAGNLNHALEHHASEPYFALVDADELLPRDFLARLVPYLAREPGCGFVQANHRVNASQRSPLGRDLGVGIDIHWRWYHPLRNRYGFVMLLGHGALIRRQAWLAARGFPELVSEDLAFAVRLRERGYYGRFAEDVVCLEDFPETVRAFRVRHMKWTRGTCEFLTRMFWPLVRARGISLTEKLDIIFPTLNMPLTFFFFLFVLDANLLLLGWFGEVRPITFVIGAQEFVLPVIAPHGAFTALGSTDFYAITLLTLLSPMLCFMIDLAHRPVRLLRFLAKSTALYGALAPLSSIGVLFYLVTGRANFLVTGDNTVERRSVNGARGLMKSLAINSHPDEMAVQVFEIGCGLVLITMAAISVQPALLGLGIAYLVLPLLHRFGWSHPVIEKLVLLPFVFIAVGLGLNGLALTGMQGVFFGFGFHF